MSFLEIFQPGPNQFAAARASRFESTAVAVARRGKNGSPVSIARSARRDWRSCASLLRAAARDFRRSQRCRIARARGPSYGGGAPMASCDSDRSSWLIGATRWTPALPSPRRASPRKAPPRPAAHSLDTRPRRCRQTTPRPEGRLTTHRAPDRHEPPRLLSLACGVSAYPRRPRPAP